LLSRSDNAEGELTSRDIQNAPPETMIFGPEFNHSTDLDQTEVTKTIDELVEVIVKNPAASTDAGNQLLRLMYESSTYFDYLITNPNVYRIPIQLMMGIALAANRRWLPIADPKKTPKRVPKVELKGLLSRFVEHCRKHGLKMELGELQRFNQTVKGGWSRASLADAMWRNPDIMAYRQNRDLKRRTRKRKPG